MNDSTNRSREIQKKCDEPEFYTNEEEMASSQCEDSGENEVISAQNLEAQTPCETSKFASIPKWEKQSLSEEDKKVRSESYRLMANVGNFGLFLLLAVLFGYFIGKTCDEFFGTKPVFTVLWIGFGVAASVLEVVRTIKAAQKLGEK